MEKVASSVPQSGMANSGSLRFVVGSSQMSVSVWSITLLRKSLCALTAYSWQVRFEISFGIHRSINASWCVLHKDKSFNSEIALALAKVRSSKVRPAKVEVRPDIPKDWVWIRPAIQSYWKEFLSLLFSTSKLGGNLAIVQSFEEAGGGEGAAHCAYL